MELSLVCYFAALIFSFNSSALSWFSTYIA
jgi:hypothetical protein